MKVHKNLAGICSILLLLLGQSTAFWFWSDAECDKPKSIERRQVAPTGGVVPTGVPQPTGGVPPPQPAGNVTLGSDIPDPEGWASQIDVTLDMYILTSNDVDMCLTSTAAGVVMETCNGKEQQLWESQDARNVTWTNVDTGATLDIREWAAMHPEQYANLIFGQGFWRPVAASPCSASCGWGTFKVKQVCVNQNGVPPAGWYNSYCDPAGRNEEVQQCPNLPACPNTDAAWSDWSACSATCGQGIQQRLCVEGFNSNVTCQSLLNNAPAGQGDTKLCDDSAENWVADCPVDGGFSAWSSCSVTCGYGVQQRVCNNPPPAFGGKDCSEQEDGLGPSVATCFSGDCPAVNGNYSEWSACSVTCGIGIQARQCNNPSPSGFGADCSQLGPDKRTCREPACPTTLTDTVTSTATISRIVGTFTRITNTASPKPTPTRPTAAAPITTASVTFNIPPTAFPSATTPASITAPPPVADDGAVPPPQGRRAARARARSEAAKLAYTQGDERNAATGASNLVLIVSGLMVLGAVGAAMARRRADRKVAYSNC